MFQELNKLVADMNKEKKEQEENKLKQNLVQLYKLSTITNTENGESYYELDESQLMVCIVNSL